MKRQRLSDKHRAVVNYYYGLANFNKTDALRRAGYKHPNHYLRVFNHPGIVEEMERRERLLRERYEVTYDNTIAEIAKIAFSNVLDMARVDEKTGDLLIDFSDAGAAQLAAVGEITVETYMEGRGDDAQEVKRVRVKPYNKLAALDALMRHAGISKDKTGEALSDLVARINAGRKRLGQETEDDSKDA